MYFCLSSFFGRYHISSTLNNLLCHYICYTIVVSFNMADVRRIIFHKLTSFLKVRSFLRTNNFQDHTLDPKNIR